MARQHRNAACSYCRKSYRDAGPLVEGPDEVYICGECVELCQSILDQERRRRSRPVAPPSPFAEAVRETMETLLAGAKEAREALVQAAINHYERPGRPSAVLLIGPARSSRVLLVLALVHALGVPGYIGDAVEGLLDGLLHAADFDIEAAQRGIVYIDGVDRVAKTRQNVSITRDVSGEGV